MLEAEVTATGDVLVEGQHVGMLQGFRFTADPKAGGAEVKALNLAAMKALGAEIESRAARVVLAGDDAFVLSHDGLVRWIGEPVARLTAGEKVLEPRLRLLVEEHLTGPAREQVEARLNLWLKNHVTRLLGALQILEVAENVTGIARGIAYQAAESLGVLERSKVGEEMKALEQDGRAALRQLGIRFGAFHLYLPALLKPAPRALAAQLWALKHGGPETAGLDDIAHLAASGRTSFPVDKAVPKGLYRAAGYRVCGERAVRVDILERLADLIRPAIAYRPGVTQGPPPTGAADQDGFVVTGAMTSLVGCAGEDFASILRSLGYVSVKRTGPAITVPLAPPPAATEPAAPVQAAPEVAETDGSTEQAVMEEAAAEQAVAEPQMEAAPEEVSADPVAVLSETAVTAAEAPAQETADVPVLTEAESEPVPADAMSALPVMAEPEAPEAAAAEMAEAAPAVPEEIEVWRPHRHQGGRRPEHGQRGRRDGEQARGERPQREGRPGGHRRDGGRPGQQQPAVARAEGEAPQRPERPRHDERPRQDERPRRDERPRQDRPEGGRSEGGRGPRPDFKRDGRPGGPRREERGGGERERFQQAPRPRPANREPDPDSPFAKLAALKAQLEGSKN